MSAYTDDQIVAGIERRFEALDHLVPEPREWWGDDVLPARVRVRVTAGSTVRGPSASRMTGRRTLVIIATAAVIAALIGAVMLIASQPRPRLTTTGLIAYVPGTPDGSPQVVVVDPLSRTDRVLADVDTDGCLEYSPDGRQLAMVLGSRSLGLFDTSTGKLRAVGTMTMSGPIAWSPDGTRVAALPWSGDSSAGIRVVTIATGTVTRIDTGGFRVFDFSWSPDGRRIAYVASATLDQTGSDPSVTLNVVGADGSGTSRLVALPWYTHVVWSPDGTRVVFARYPPGTIIPADGSAIPADGSAIPADGSGPGGQRDIVSLSIDGRSERNLTQSPEDEAEVAWSPDGTRIAFTRAIGHTDTGTEWQVITIAPDGTRVTAQSGSGRIVWSTDSKQLLMYGYRGGGRGGFLTILAADAGRPPVSLVVRGPVTFQGCGPTWQHTP